jgi:hypothetical protein
MPTRNNPQGIAADIIPGGIRNGEHTPWSDPLRVKNPWERGLGRAPGCLRAGDTRIEASSRTIPGRAVLPLLPGPNLRLADRTWYQRPLDHHRLAAGWCSPGEALGDHDPGGAARALDRRLQWHFPEESAWRSRLTTRCPTTVTVVADLNDDLVASRRDCLIARAQRTGTRRTHRTVRPHRTTQMRIHCWWHGYDARPLVDPPPSFLREANWWWPG